MRGTPLLQGTVGRKVLTQTLPLIANRYVFVRGGDRYTKSYHPCPRRWRESYHSTRRVGAKSRVTAAFGILRQDEPCLALMHELREVAREMNAERSTMLSHFVTHTD